jgi:hypothetical protein
MLLSLYKWHHIYGIMEREKNSGKSKIIWTVNGFQPIISLSSSPSFSLGPQVRNQPNELVVTCAPVLHLEIELFYNPQFISVRLWLRGWPWKQNFRSSSVYSFGM